MILSIYSKSTAVLLRPFFHKEKKEIFFTPTEAHCGDKDSVIEWVNLQAKKHNIEKVQNIHLLR